MHIFHQLPIALLLLLSTAASGQVVRDFTLPVDAVDLLDRGTETRGEERFSTIRGRFTYLFTSEANRAAFLSHPERYEIQFGGACARMGPLSGGGTPRLYAAHAGRLYIFASESCRMRFLESPEAFIGSDDPAPAVTDESRARGRELLGRAVDAIACLAFIDTISTYSETLARDEEAGGATYHVTETLTLRFPGGVRSETCWNESCYGYVADGEKAWFIKGAGDGPMAPVQRQALIRGPGRHFITILRDRHERAMRIAAAGEKRTVECPGEGSLELSLVTVHRDGATTVLGLDEKHRVRLMSFRDRGPGAVFGTIDRIYSGYHKVGGLNLPGRVDVLFDGQPVPDWSGDFAAQRVNDPADAKLLDPPAIPGATEVQP
jgi:YHS domain-containing protein